MSGPHDKLFKKSFEDPKVAAAHFRDSLPASVVPMLDLAKLRLEPGSYVDESLNERHSDLLFSAPWIASPEDSANCAGTRKSHSQRSSALLYLLFEQQSKVDRLMPLRMLRYELRIWDRWLVANPKAKLLPAIFPLVLYSGDRRWTAPLRFEALLNVPLTLQPTLFDFVPRLRIALQSLYDFEPNELPGDLQGKLVLSFLRKRSADSVFAHYRDNITAVNSLLMPERLQVFRRLLNYSWTISDGVDHQAYLDVAAEVGPDAVEIAMTVSERLIAQGEARGVALALQNAKTNLVKNLESRGVQLSRDSRDHIEACNDMDLVFTWLGRSGYVQSVGELFEH